MNKKNSIREAITSMASNKKLRYLLVGTWNTIFGYLCAVGLYYYFGELLGVIVIGIVSNIASISMSFITYKMLVFKTHGNWLSEYLKTFLVYGMSSLIGIFILYVGVSRLKFEFWIVQGLAIILVAILSYLTHSKFTFKTINT
jgi:putative flippase GtrA